MSRRAPLFQFAADDGIVVAVWFVYILRCADRSLYVGETSDVATRLAKHNEGGSKYTASRRPVTLVYTEQHEGRYDCLQREQQLKGWTRVKKEALIAGDVNRLRTL